MLVNSFVHDYYNAIRLVDVFPRNFYTILRIALYVCYLTTKRTSEILGVIQWPKTINIVIQ